MDIAYIDRLRYDAPFFIIPVPPTIISDVETAFYKYAKNALIQSKIMAELIIEKRKITVLGHALVD